MPEICFGQPLFYLNTVELSEINIYPVKGLKGIKLQESPVEPLGLRYDRRWMLVDINGKFISQREFPVLSKLNCLHAPNGFRICSVNESDFIEIPFSTGGEILKVMVWEDVVEAVIYNKIVDAWFSDFLKTDCTLVYLPEESDRWVDPKYNRGKDKVSFADAFPVLLIGEASLEDLNLKLEHPISMDRFRPNLVFTGGLPFEEDTFDKFQINDTVFVAAKPCARCQVITIDQQTSMKSKEPLTTLSSYRTRDNKVNFGQNLLVETIGKPLRIGDRLEVLSRKPLP